MKVKTERRSLRLALKNGHVTKEALFAQVTDDNYSRRQRRSVALILGMYPPPIPDQAPQNYEWKYRKTVGGYRIKKMKQPKMISASAPAQIEEVSNDNPVN